MSLCKELCRKKAEVCRQRAWINAIERILEEMKEEGRADIEAIIEQMERDLQSCEKELEECLAKC